MGKLNYTLSGEAGASAVLFLHGFMGSAEDWRGTMAALDERYLCLAVDLPGHGGSVGLPREDYTFEGAALRVLDLLDELDIERPTIVGYSMGGRLALYLALRYPERCAGLFLESASPGIEGAAERRARREADEERARSLEEDDLQDFLVDWYGQPLFASLARREGLVHKTIEARLRNRPEELAVSLRGMGAGNQPSLWGELEGLAVPKIAVAGALDGKFAGISRRMQTASPHVRATVVPGAGHNVRLEAPEVYLKLLQDLFQAI